MNESNLYEHIENYEEKSPKLNQNGPGRKDSRDGFEERSLSVPNELFNTKSMAIGANDGPVDDFLEMVDGWEDLTGRNLLSDALPSADSSEATNAVVASDALEQIAVNFSPREMRELGGSIIKLADALDQNWDPAAVRSTYHWITHAGRIERNSLELAKVAIRSRDNAKRRKRHISPEFFGEPAWEMLLELFIQFSGQADVSTKSLCLVSGVSDTTSLRLLDRLADVSLIERTQSLIDKRVTLVRLTRQGVVAVGSILADQAS